MVNLPTPPIARSSIAAGAALGTIVRLLLRAPFGAPAIALAPFASRLRSGGRRPGGFPLQPDGAPAGIKNLHQALHEHDGLGAFYDSFRSFQVIEGGQDI